MLTVEFSLFPTTIMFGFETPVIAIVLGLLTIVIGLPILTGFALGGGRVNALAGWFWGFGGALWTCAVVYALVWGLFQPYQEFYGLILPWWLILAGSANLIFWFIASGTLIAQEKDRPVLVTLLGGHLWLHILIAAVFYDLGNIMKKGINILLSYPGKHHSEREVSGAYTNLEAMEIER